MTHPTPEQLIAENRRLIDELYSEPHTELNTIGVANDLGVLLDAMAKLIAENEALKAERGALKFQVSSADFFGEGRVEAYKHDAAAAHARARAAERQIAELCEALKPFAVAMTEAEKFVQGEGYARSQPIGHVCTADFKTARAAYLSALQALARAKGGGGRMTPTDTSAPTSSDEQG